jgi:hypothetical protein
LPAPRLERETLSTTPNAVRSSPDGNWVSTLGDRSLRGSEGIQHRYEGPYGPGADAA